MGLTVEQYIQEMKALLPRGIFWETEDGDVLNNLLSALSEELARIDARATGLLDEVDPRTVYELLPDSERELGLPDSCTDQVDTLAERRDALHSKLISVGGQSRQYFIDIIAVLGYVVTITEFKPYFVTSAVNYPIYDTRWRFVFQINAPATTVRLMTVCDEVNSGLRMWGNASLECLTNKLKPAHTQVIFSYEG